MCDDFLNQLDLSVGKGRYRVNIKAFLTAQGVSVTLTGGEKPHVGCMVLSVPRPSLAGGRISCDTWITPVPGHKDHHLAVLAAELICRQTELVTAVTAGVHIKEAQPWEIEELVENGKKAAQELGKKITEILGAKRCTKI